MNAQPPAHLTDPDAIDAWLEKRDAAAGVVEAGGLDEVDAAVARLLSGSSSPTGQDPGALARRQYGELPFWRRWRTKTPAGYRPDPSGLGRPVTWG